MLIDNVKNLVILILILRINSYEFRVWPWKKCQQYVEKQINFEMFSQVRYSHFVEGWMT